MITLDLLSIVCWRFENAQSPLDRPLAVEVDFAAAWSRCLSVYQYRFGENTASNMSFKSWTAPKNNCLLDVASKASCVNSTIETMWPYLGWSNLSRQLRLTASDLTSLEALERSWDRSSKIRVTFSRWRLSGPCILSSAAQAQGNCPGADAYQHKRLNLSAAGNSTSHDIVAIGLAICEKCRVHIPFCHPRDGKQ